ncbi:response regulator [candidate division KSB1 bacterium]|nr:response regulator [candidate division KSB1 bacterium]
MDKGKILIIESHPETPDSISNLLDDEGFAPATTDENDNVLETAASEKPNLILIDMESVRADVWELCRNLKEDYETRKSAVILLSSQSDEELVVKAFESGADDFVSKPISKKKFVARLKAILRRMERNETKKIKVKDIEIDLDEHKVKKAGKPIDLTYIQFKLLYLLASRRENVFSRKEILEKVWGRKVYVTNRTVDVHIKRLREKLGEYKYPSQYIETIHGTGYRFL